MSKFELSEKKLKNLEIKWDNAIEKEARYWRENDAKIRAVTKAETYEEFSDIVKASHLKPMERKEILNLKQKKIWNNAVQSKVQINNITCTKVNNRNTAPKEEENFIPRFAAELVHVWTKLDSSEQINLLKRLNSTKLEQLLRVESPPSMLSDLAISLKPDDSELIWQAELLLCLTHSARFHLNLQFLSSKEKQCYQLLLDHFRKKEEIISEQTVSQIKEKFDLH